MCDQCPQLKDEVTAKHGPVVVALMHDPVSNELNYTASLGAAMVMVILPVKQLATGEAAQCALFIGAHLPELLAATSGAFMERYETEMAASVVEDLEAMLRDGQD